MTDVTFETLEQRLAPEAKALFIEMAAAHLESTGDRKFVRADSFGGTHMIFTGDGPNRSFSDFDGGAVEDLIGAGLLHVAFSSRGTPNYRVTGGAQQFYRWLRESHGSPLAQIEEQMRSMIDGVTFATNHPGASHHLREAFELLWSGRTDEQVISEIGDHLRKAIMDATTDVVGETGQQEKPIQRLQTHIQALNLPGREAQVAAQVVELARVVLRLDHRLNHIRDEADNNEPPVTWEETRRAAFVSAFACYELDRIRQR
jgi:hypothetical protein